MSERLKHPYFGEHVSKESMMEGWDRASSSYSYKRYEIIRDRVVADLLGTGVLRKDSTVLDIGCGNGSFSLSIAPHVKKVYAMDASKGMLSELTKAMERSRIGNIVPVECDWETGSIEGRYDVVMTSLCPPTNTPESLMKMESVSKGKCVYISSINESASTHVRIWNGLGKDYSFAGYNTQYPYEYLRGLGRDAVLRTYAQVNHIDVPYETALNDEIGRFSQYGRSGSEVRGIAENVLRPLCTDGRVIYDHEMKMGMLVWTPKITS